MQPNQDNPSRQFGHDIHLHCAEHPRHATRTNAQSRPTRMQNEKNFVDVDKRGEAFIGTTAISLVPITPNGAAHLLSPRSGTSSTELLGLHSSGVGNEEGSVVSNQGLLELKGGRGVLVLGVEAED